MNYNIKRPKIKRWEEKNFINLSNNQAAYGKYKKYPYTYPLYEAFAKKWNTNIDNILITRGAEEGLRIIYDRYVTPDSIVLRPDPTFGMVEVFEQMNEAKVITISYDNQNIEYSWLKIIEKYKSKISLIYIAHPDNPTILKAIVSRAKKYKIKVLLDLTYYSYMTIKSTIPEDVIIVDSLSKSHGLAGLRVGCINANKKIINELRTHRPMDEVNDLAVIEGVKAINSSIANKNKKHAIKWHNIFMKKFPDNYEITYTNFIILRFNDNKHIYYYNKLYENKILTRIKFDHPYMDGVLRVSIGSNKVMKKILRVLK